MSTFTFGGVSCARGMKIEGVEGRGGAGAGELKCTKERWMVAFTSIQQWSNSIPTIPGGRMLEEEAGALQMSLCVGHCFF